MIDTPQSIGRYKTELRKSEERRLELRTQYPDEWNECPLTRKHALTFNPVPTHYFTAKPCPKGHLARRFTSGGNCETCLYLAVKERCEKQKEHNKKNPKQRKKPGLRKTTEEHSEEVKKLGRVLLIGEYLGARKNTHYLCIEHDEIWPAMPSNILKGRGLLCCKRENSGNEPISREDHIERLRKLGRDFELVGEYLGANKMTKYKCNKHKKIYSAVPAQIIRGSGLKCCRDSYYEEISSKTLEDRKRNHLKIIKKFGKVKLIGDFVDSKTRTKYLCLTHNEVHESTPGDTASGQGLKCCQTWGRSSESYRQKKELEHLELVKEIGKVEFIGPYINTQTSTWYRCLKHNERHKTSPNNISQGKSLKCCKYQNLFDYVGEQFDQASKNLDENIKARLIRLEEYKVGEIPILFKCLAHNEVHKAAPLSTSRGHGLICCRYGSTRDNLDMAIEDNLPNKDKKNDFYLYHLKRFPEFQKIGLANHHIVRAKRSKQEYGDPIAIWERDNRREAFFLEQALLSQTALCAEAPKELVKKRWQGWTEVRKINDVELKNFAQFLVDELEVMGSWAFAIEYIPMNPKQRNAIEKIILSV